jgi:predicted ferric reductase
MIDGPFSTPSRSMIDAEHIVLVSGGLNENKKKLLYMIAQFYIFSGIGVTPFASLLQSLWIRYSHSLKICDSCNNEWYEDPNIKKLKKVNEEFSRILLVSISKN